MFTSREKGNGPLFVSKVFPGAKIKYEIKDGDHITLKLEAETVLVRSVIKQHDGTFTGEIYGFEDTHNMTLGPLSIGDVVRFSEENIFSCFEP